MRNKRPRLSFVEIKDVNYNYAQKHEINYVQTDSMTSFAFIKSILTLPHNQISFFSDLNKRQHQDNVSDHYLTVHPNKHIFCSLCIDLNEKCGMH